MRLKGPAPPMAGPFMLTTYLSVVAWTVGTVLRRVPTAPKDPGAEPPAALNPPKAGGTWRLKQDGPKGLFGPAGMGHQRQSWEPRDPARASSGGEMFIGDPSRPHIITQKDRFLGQEEKKRRRAGGTGSRASTGVADLVQGFHCKQLRNIKQGQGCLFFLGAVHRPSLELAPSVFRGWLGWEFASTTGWCDSQAI